MTDDLPPLPEPDFSLDSGDEPCYYAHTVRAYGDARAAAAVARERERCARICGDEDVAPTDDPCGVQKCIAAAIRKGE